MRRFMYLAALLLSVQLALAALVFARGFPYFGSSLIASAPLWELPVAAFHLPGIEALSAVGLCCGFTNGLVLKHTIVGGHIPMRVIGTTILASTNWLCWMVIALLGQGALSAWRARATRPHRPAESGGGDPA
jgi:hypothetical protein